MSKKPFRGPDGALHVIEPRCQHSGGSPTTRPERQDWEYVTRTR